MSPPVAFICLTSPCVSLRWRGQGGTQALLSLECRNSKSPPPLQPCLLAPAPNVLETSPNGGVASSLHPTRDLRRSSFNLASACGCHCFPDADVTGIKPQQQTDWPEEGGIYINVTYVAKLPPIKQMPVSVPLRPCQQMAQTSLCREALICVRREVEPGSTTGIFWELFLSFAQGQHLGF